LNFRVDKIGIYRGILKNIKNVATLLPQNLIERPENADGKGDFCRRIGEEALVAESYRNLHTLFLLTGDRLGVDRYTDKVLSVRQIKKTKIIIQVADIAESY